MKNADARVRLHIWPQRDGSASWSVGPVGTRFPALSPGAGLDCFIKSHRPKGAVVILEGESA